MNHTSLLALVLSASALAASPALAQDAPLKTVDGILVNADGMTVYSFDKDAPNSGKSVCNGDCAKNWPPVLAQADAKATGELSLVTRDDASKQWAYKGKPVYLFIKDTKKGDRNGDNVKDVWHVITP